MVSNLKEALCLPAGLQGLLVTSELLNGLRFVPKSFVLGNKCKQFVVKLSYGFVTLFLLC